MTKTTKSKSSKKSAKRLKKAPKTPYDANVGMLLDDCVEMLSPEDEKALWKFLGKSGKNPQAYVSLEDPSELPLAVVDAILENQYNYSNPIRIKFQRYRNDLPVTATAEEIAKKVVRNPREFYDAFGRFVIAANQKFQENNSGRSDNYDYDEDNEEGTVGPTPVEFELNGRWYPIAIQPRFGRGMIGPYVTIQAGVVIADQVENKTWFISLRDFPKDLKREVTVESLLNRHKLRLTQPESEQKHAERIQRAAELAGKHGQVMTSVNTGVRMTRFFFQESFEGFRFGTEDHPVRVIVESDLEATRAVNYTGGNTLPFVRVFSTELKEYLYVDIDDFRSYTWDESAIEHLVVPDQMDKILRPVFEASVNNLFGDLVKGKHGGMVILAEGSPGTGKTLTAEVFAEHSKRPLYTMEVGELGIKIDQIESNLQRIFQRAARWNAVLLLDEADIFMTERGDDLERSAIVGVFLRLLDYYPGLLFLTTNRNQTIDQAFKSRVTLKLSYQKLTPETREKIWRMMFDRAGLKLAGSTETDTPTSGADSAFQELALEDLNGRQIRNVVRLLRVAHPDGKITFARAREIIGFSAR